MAGADDADPGAAGEPDPEALAARFEALANPRRIRLLTFLTEPHYLEEIASHMGISRQAAGEHVDRLVEIEALERRSATRESGPVTEYVIAPEAISLIHHHLVKLGSLRPRPGDRGGPPRTRGPGQTGQLRKPPPVPCLWVLRGLDAGRGLSLTGPGQTSWLVGRDETCDLVLDADPFLSARHAEVWREGPDLLIQDLASTNGTRLNTEELGRNDSPKLAHGDVIEVGRTAILFRSD